MTTSLQMLLIFFLTKNLNKLILYELKLSISYRELYYQKSLSKVETLLSKYTAMPDTISPQIKEGLADIDYQMGDVGQYKKLMEAIAQGNYPQIVEQSKVRFGPQGKVDIRRHQLRL